MGCFRRALYSNINYKKRFLLMLVIILIASVLLQVTYQISSAASDSVSSIRKDIGASVTVHIKNKKGTTTLVGMIKEEYFSYDAAKEMGSLPEVKISHYFCVVNVSSKDIKGRKTGAMKEEDYNEISPNYGDFDLIGVRDLQSFWNFKSGKDHLIEGNPITPESDKTDAVISEGVMDYSLKKIGDTINVSSFFDTGRTAELKIAGIHSGHDLNLIPEHSCNINYIYTSLETAVGLTTVNGITEAEYELNDPLESKAFITKAKSIAEKYGLNLDFTENNLKFLLASTALNSLIKTCDAIFITVIALAAVILSLLVIYLMNDRLFEIGILLSLGERRVKIGAQMVLEVLMPAILGINLGVLISVLIMPYAGKAAAASMQITQQLTSVNIGGLFLLANACGILLVVIASIIPTIAIGRFTPKQILQKFK